MEFYVYLTRLAEETVAAEQAKVEEGLALLTPAQAEDPGVIRALQLTAYDWAWGPTSPNFSLLEAVRPQRASGAELLTADVRYARVRAAVAEAAQKKEARQTTRGRLLPINVEAVYDAYVAALNTTTRTLDDEAAKHVEAVKKEKQLKTRAEGLRATADAAKAANEDAAEQATKEADAAAAEQEATEATTELAATPPGQQPAEIKTAATAAAELVWAGAAPEVLQKRPQQGSTLDFRAILDAQRRAAGTPADPKSKLAKADGVAETVDGIAQGAATLIGIAEFSVAARGTKLDNDHAENKALNKKNGVGTPWWTSDPTGIGAAIHSSREAEEFKATGNRQAKPLDYEESAHTQAAAGIGSVTSMFTSVISSVSSLLKFLSAIKEARDADNADPRKGLKAGKAGVDALAQLTDTAKTTADLAVFINDKLDDNVRKVIPGLNIVSAVLSVASNVMDLVSKAERMSETNNAIRAARLNPSYGAEINELVYPLLRVAQRYSQNLEKVSWDTAIAITEVITSISTVASGGGFGIPTAVQTGIGALDKLHSLGHVIADQVTAYLSKEAVKSSTGALEGSSEEILRHNPGVAVDAIILRAARKDETAVAFLANYRVDGKTVDADMLEHVALRPMGQPKALVPGPTTSTSDGPGVKEQTSANVDKEHNRLFEIRSAVLEEMGESADPDYIFNTWKAKASSFVSAVAERWRVTGEVADQRNRLGQTTLGAQSTEDRGFFWRANYFLTRSSKSERLRNQTSAEWDAAANVAVQCGKFQMADPQSVSDVQKFETELKTLPIAEIQVWATTQKNTKIGAEYLLKYIADRTADERLAAARKYLTTTGGGTP